MGRYMAAELLDSDFFEGVDVIIPIPLHKKKQQFRDYNQSECIARGIAAVMGIAVCGIGSPPEEYGDTDTQIRIRALGECGWNF